MTLLSTALQWEGRVRVLQHREPARAQPYSLLPSKYERRGFAVGVPSAPSGKHHRPAVRRCAYRYSLGPTPLSQVWGVRERAFSCQRLRGLAWRVRRHTRCRPQPARV
jgi:hypothetical protein